MRVPSVSRGRWATTRVFALCLLVTAQIIAGGCRQELVLSLSLAPPRLCGTPVMTAYFGNSESVILGTPDADATLVLASYGIPSSEIICVDWRSGERVSLEIPSRGGYGAALGKDGSVYIGGVEPGNLYRHRCGEDTVTVIESPEHAIEYIWRLAVAESGRIYGAGAPGAMLLEYDPEIGTSAVYGPLSSNAGVARAVAVDSRDRVWCGLGWPSELVIFDPETEAVTHVEAGEITGSFIYDMWAVDRLMLCAIAYSGPLLIFDSDTLAVVASIEPPPEQFYWRIVHNGSDSEDVYLFGRPSGDLYRYALSTGKLDLILPGVWNVCAVVRDRYVLSVDDGKLRVHDLQSGQAISSRKLSGERQSTNISAIACSEEGAVYGGAALSNHLWVYTRDNGLEDLGQVVQGGGQIDSMCITQGGLLYLGVYPYARIVAYDPSRSFTHNASDISNPGPAVAVGNGQFRILTMVELDNGHVYMGTAPAYGTAGLGSLARYDPGSGCMSSWSDVVPGGTVLELSSDGRLLLGCGAGTFFAWDPDSETVVCDLALPGVNKVLHVGRSRAMAAGGKTLWLVDCDEGRVVKTMDVPEGPITALCFSLTNDVLAITEEAVYLVCADLRVPAKVLLEQGGLLAQLAPDGTLYFVRGCDLLSTEVWR